MPRFKKCKKFMPIINECACIWNSSHFGSCVSKLHFYAKIYFRDLLVLVGSTALGKVRKLSLNPTRFREELCETFLIAISHRSARKRLFLIGNISLIFIFISVSPERDSNSRLCPHESARYTLSLICLIVSMAFEFEQICYLNIYFLWLTAQSVARPTDTPELLGSSPGTDI